MSNVSKTAKMLKDHRNIPKPSIKVLRSRPNRPITSILQRSKFAPAHWNDESPLITQYWRYSAARYFYNYIPSLFSVWSCRPSATEKHSHITVKSAVNRVTNRTYVPSTPTQNCDPILLILSPHRQQVHEMYFGSLQCLSVSLSDKRRPRYKARRDIRPNFDAAKREGGDLLKLHSPY